MAKFEFEYVEYFPDARPSSLPVSCRCGTIEAESAEEALGVGLIKKGENFETAKFYAQKEILCYDAGNKTYSVKLIEETHDIGGGWQARYDSNILVIFKGKEAIYLSEQSQATLKKILK